MDIQVKCFRHQKEHLRAVDQVALAVLEARSVLRSSQRVASVEEVELDLSGVDGRDFDFVSRFVLVHRKQVAALVTGLEECVEGVDCYLIVRIGVDFDSFLAAF